MFLLELLTFEINYFNFLNFQSLGVEAYKEERSETDAPNILHSQKFILLDDSGFIRGFYDDDSTDLKRLIKDYHRIKSFF